MGILVIQLIHFNIQWLLSFMFLQFSVDLLVDTVYSTTIQRKHHITKDYMWY